MNPSNAVESLKVLFSFRFHCNATTAFLAIAIIVSDAEVNAAVSSTAGSVAQIPPPASVVLSALEHDTAARLFLEREAFLLPTTLSVDVTQPGPVDEAVQLTPGLVYAGTNVNSYLLHADPIGNGIPIKHYEGAITFNMRILGVIVNAVPLNQSDPVVGSLTTLYIPRNPDSGFEGPGYPNRSLPVRDTLAISTDMRTLSFYLRVESRLDQIRIITAAVPEPGSLVLGITAAIFVAAGRGYRRRR